MMAASPSGRENALNCVENMELAPEVTYRHVLKGDSIGSNHPLRVIAHCDIDAAYAQFEMRRLNVDPEQPLVVQQWASLIAINYPARRFGITRHESAVDAKKKCPDLLCVHVATYRTGIAAQEGDQENEAEVGYWDNARPETHKVSLDPYRRESLKILKVFSETCPTIEKASIDEAFLDLSLPVRAILLERFPHIAALPEGFSLDDPLPAPETFSPPLNEAWNIVPLRPNPNVDDDSAGEKDENPQVETDDLAEKDPRRNQTPVDAIATTWGDIALMLGAELMQKCREAVHNTLGYTCSAGIARNKALAKLCSSLKKPDAQTVLRNGAISSFLRPLSFQKLRFLGGKLGDKIAEEYDAQTIGDLLQISLEELRKTLGDESGLWVHNLIRGIDDSPVTPKTQSKSMLSAKNFRPSISTMDEAMHWLKVLSTDLNARLAEARDLSPGLWPKTIVLHHRNSSYVTRSKQAPFPYTSDHRNLSHHILKQGEKLLKQIAEEKRVVAGKKETGIGLLTNLSLGFNGLETLESGQKGIEGFFQQSAFALAGPSTSTATNSPGKRKRDVDEEDEEDTSISNAGASSSSNHLSKIDDKPKPKKKKKLKRPSYTCSRCQKSIPLPETAEPDTDDDETEQSNDEISHSWSKALNSLKQEHEDYHFGKDLLDEDRETAKREREENDNAQEASTSILSKPKKKKKRKKTKDGQRDLNSFFRPAGAG